MPELPADDPRPLTEDERLSAASDWTDYRAAYGVESKHMVAAHAALIAGWAAGRGSQR